MMSVVIGGGKGFVGRHLRPLLQSKYKIYNVTRTPKETTDISWEVLKTSGLPKDCHAIVGLQGTPLLQQFRVFDDSARQQIRQSRIDTMALLIKAVNELPDPNPVKVVVSMSGVGFYPPSEDAEYTESWDGGESASKDFVRSLSIEWEKAAAPKKGIRHVILRSGIVLGRDGGMISNLYPSFWLGLGGTFSSGTQWLPWIHVDDLVALIVEAINCPKMNGVYNAVAPSAHITNAQFTKAFANSFSPKRPAFLSIPAFALRAMFGKELADNVVLSGQRVRSEKIPRDIPNFQFKHPDINEACASLHTSASC